VLATTNMPRGQEPLLANERPPSQISNEDRIAEEDALLTGQSTGKKEATTYARRNWREIGLFAWAFIATAVVIVLAVVVQHSRAEHGAKKGASIPEGKRNLIFMVSDGMGPTSLALTRGFRQHVDQLPWDNTLLIDQHLIGQSRTRSSSSLVTDSAAGATAFSCGQKSYNGAISVLPGFEPCGSVMEAAKRMGYTTGLVVTTRITDATPAVFASHVRRREMEDDIAMQMIGETHPLGRVVDLMFGGGRCHFLPNDTEHSCRGDDTDVIDIAEESYIDNRDDFDSLGTSIELPMLGLFAQGDIPYEIDRRFQDDTYPSLKEMAKTALNALSSATQDSEQGFFIMIEGSRIDHAGHANDPAAQVHEVLAYDQTIAAVLDFIEDSDVPTLMVSTSDHETGGLATARQLDQMHYPHYLWYPGVLANSSHSSSWAASQYHAHLDTLGAHPSDLDVQSNESMKSYLKSLISKGLGIHDTSDAELDELLTNPDIAAYTFADMISRRAQLGWSTHGHSAADVNIFASNAAWAEDLVGNHENTEVGEFLRKYLGVEEEVKKVTRELQKKMNVNMLGAVPENGERLDWQDHLERYHGNSKRCDVCGA
jgi:alkaline phosphatase